MFKILWCFLPFFCFGSFASPQIESQDLLILAPVTIKKIVLKEKRANALGSGRELVFEVVTNSCLPLAGQIKGNPPKRTVVVVSGVANMDLKKYPAECEDQSFLFKWDPALNEKVKRSKMTVDFTNDAGKGYRASFNAFRSTGEIGPGSAPTSIIDYDQIRINPIK